jgi:hypothetical protein
MASEGAQDSLRGAAIAIVAAAIGALGSLGGTYLANNNARSQLASQIAHEDMVRQANIRRDVYKRFIVAVHEFEARDRCLWHAGGTAGENDEARIWQRRPPTRPEGEASPR